MKILVITNNKDYNAHTLYWTSLRKNAVKNKHKIRMLKRSDLLNFYSEYLRFKPDIIVASWIPAGLLPAVLNKLGLIKCPLVHTWDDYYSEGIPDIYPKSIVRWLERLAIKYSDYITTMMLDNEKKARAMGKPTSFFYHGRMPDGVPTKIKLKSRRTKVLYLGEQSRYKQVDKLIRAMDGLKCDLFLVGKPNPEFQKFAGKNVHFVGYVHPSEVPAVLKQADILVNTSTQAANFKLFEYLHAGKAILAYRGREIPMLKHGKTAYLTSNFRAGLKKLITDKKLRNRLSKNAKNFKTYSWDEIANQYLDLYAEIINQY